MTNILASPNIVSILAISCLFLAFSAVIIILRKVQLKWYVFAIILACALLLTGLSFFFTYEWMGGTLTWTNHGWPHFYYVSGVDLDGSTTVAHFSLGPIGSYLASNILFYCSIITAIVFGIKMLLPLERKR